MGTSLTPSPSTFLLLFRNTGQENYQHLTPQERDAATARWNAWFFPLLESGKAVEGQPLEAQTRLVSGPGRAGVVDGPFAETREAIGGYVKLRVNSLEEATAIAQAHPGLDFGMKIEVRELTPSCHLGVITLSGAA
ncbi:MAG: YciI family protein [Opitutaceae bacterium]